MVIRKTVILITMVMLLALTGDCAFNGCRSGFRVRNWRCSNRCQSYEICCAYDFGRRYLFRCDNRSNQAFNLTLRPDSEYKSQLDEANQRKARDELFERNDKDRDSAVQNLRKWVLEQKQWMNTPTDYAFLLRFLRVRKFSQLEARLSIERYWALKDENKSIFRDMDTTDPLMIEMLREGMFLCSKKYDKDGCRLLIGRPGRMSVEKVNKKWGGRDKIYRLMFMVYEWILMDESTQVNGIKVIWEYTDLTMGHVKMMTGTDNNRLAVKFQDKCMPARLKGMYLYNEPAFIEALLVLFKPFMSQKLRDRMIGFGKNLSLLYDYTGTSVMPDEYLPDDHTGPSAGSEKQIVEEMINEMTSPKVRAHIKEITSSKYGVDLKKKPVEDQVASFRKLNI